MDAIKSKYTVTCDKDHIYRVDGVIKPGFSEIISSIGFSKNKFWTDEGRDEGQALHQWLLFLAQGNEPSEEPDERIAGRVEGIRKFLAKHSFNFIGGETPLYSNTHGFCTTPDLWGYLDGQASVIEAKRGARMARHRLQTAAQATALSSNDFYVSCRYALYLKDGGFSLELHEDDEDFESWLAILAAYNSREIYK